MKKKKTWKFTQLVLVQPDNCGPYLELFVSHKPIHIEDVGKHFEDVDGFNFDCGDGITFIDSPTKPISI